MIHKSTIVLLFSLCFARSWDLYKTELLDDDCDPDTYESYADSTDPSFYFECDPFSRLVEKRACIEIQGVRKVFDNKSKFCLFPDSLKQNAAGSAKVGDTCSYNTDCLDGMYCSSGECTCLSTYVERDKYCYIKVNPTQGGCYYQEQCDSVWPLSTCTVTGTNSAGVCNCPTNTVGAETRDGWVCVVDNNNAGITTAQCPLPVPYNDGVTSHPPNSQLKYAGTTTTATCVVGSTDTTSVSTCYSQATNGYSVIDIYDCVISGTTKQPSTSGICCANRALACIMPQQTDLPTAATAGGGEDLRWWYNSITGTCEQFVWVVQGSSNANNFLTRAHCESYCKTTCGRGPPEYDTVSNIFQSNRPSTCSSSSSCGGNYDCTTIGSFQYCCPKSSYVCERFGGLATVPTSVTTNYNPGFITSALTGFPQNRYYFDETTRSCEVFSYQGQGGNFNNFFTQNDCENYCEALLCDKGSPIKDASGENMQCSSNSNCPSSHQCNNNVCCPRSQTVCAEPKQIGTCNRYVQRYWYDAITKECELFTYSGCQGNDNNFDTVLDCQNYCKNARPEPRCIQGEAYKDTNGNYYACSNTGVGNLCPSNYECYYDGFVYGCCPIKSYTCSLQSSIGVSCGPKSVRWYYDTTTSSCQTFEYLGCNGNPNNFPSRELCENYCGVGGCPFGGDPYRDSDNTLRVCSAGVTCPSTHECNTVYTGSSEINYCCPTRATICSRPPNQVQNCGGSISLTRYYYNLATRECVQFEYFGCTTNYNNFATLSQCNNFCSSSACGVGEAAFIDPATQRPTTCNIALNNSCPFGYNCNYDRLTGNNVCCGSTDMNVCPRPERAFVDPFTLSAKECTPNIAASCTNNYLCRFRRGTGVLSNKYYCCKSEFLCPANKAVYRDPNNNRPQTCALSSVVNPCPTDYSCQTQNVGTGTDQAFQGYCCTIDPICPNNGVFETDRLAGAPKSCVTSSSNACSLGYQCVVNSTAAQRVAVTGYNTYGYCCTPGTPNVCAAAGQSPYIINNQPVVCNRDSPTACPIGYTCNLYPATSTYYCCSTVATLPSDNCPAGSTAYRGFGNAAQTCSPTGIQVCPAGYNCIPGRNGQYACCSGGIASNDGCPSGQIAYSQGNVGGSQQCTIGQLGGCPIGYNCEWSSTLNRYQCCGISAGCPNGQVAYISNSGSVQTCAQSFNSCPTGYACQQTTTGGLACCTTGGFVNQQIIPQTCLPNQDLINGVCVTRQNIFRACPISSQQIDPRVQSCSPNFPNACSPGYTCQRANDGSFLCCGNANLNFNQGQACPAGSNVFMDPRTNAPQFCVGNPNACPAGYQCYYSAALRQYYCCSVNNFVQNPIIQPIQPVQTYRACNQGSAFLFPGTQTPLDCSRNRANCPPGNFCSYSNQYNAYICCSGFRNVRGKPPKDNKGWAPKANEMKENGSTPSWNNQPDNQNQQEQWNGNQNKGPQPRWNNNGNNGNQNPSNPSSSSQEQWGNNRNNDKQNPVQPSWGNNGNSGSENPPSGNQGQWRNNGNNGQNLSSGQHGHWVVDQSNGNQDLRNGRQGQDQSAQGHWVVRPGQGQGQGQSQGQGQGQGLGQNGNQPSTDGADTGGHWVVVGSTTSNGMSQNENGMPNVQSGQPMTPQPFRPANLINQQGSMQAQCNPDEPKQYGQECCAETQCQYQCGFYKGKSMCMCPRHLLIDLTIKPHRCVSSCAKWRDGVFCTEFRSISNNNNRNNRGITRRQWNAAQQRNASRSQARRPLAYWNPGERAVLKRADRQDTTQQEQPQQSGHETARGQQRFNAFGVPFS